jgi:hypothetical protein
MDQITAEQEATQSLVKLFEHARRTQMLYERAHMALPEPLKRLLGMVSPNGAGRGSNLTIPPPTPPPAPLSAKPDWIWIEEESATPTTVALAVLRAAKSPLRAKEVVNQVIEILPSVPRGSVNNIGTRLSGKQIDRTEEVFHKNELAVHRRYAILHLLGIFYGGLQPRQILEHLRRCTWVHAPVNKDLLKADLEILDRQEKKIRRVGNSGKWELAPAKEAMKLDT